MISHIRDIISLHDNKLGVGLLLNTLTTKSYQKTLVKPVYFFRGFWGWLPRVGVGPPGFEHRTFGSGLARERQMLTSGDNADVATECFTRNIETTNTPFCGSTSCSHSLLCKHHGCYGWPLSYAYGAPLHVSVAMSWVSADSCTPALWRVLPHE